MDSEALQRKSHTQWFTHSEVSVEPSQHRPLLYQGNCACIYGSFTSTSSETVVFKNTKDKFLLKANLFHHGAKAGSLDQGRGCETAQPCLVKALRTHPAQPHSLEGGGLSSTSAIFKFTNAAQEKGSSSEAEGQAKQEKRTQDSGQGTLARCQLPAESSYSARQDAQASREL